MGVFVYVRVGDALLAVRRPDPACAGARGGDAQATRGAASSTRDVECRDDARAVVDADGGSLDPFAPAGRSLRARPARRRARRPAGARCVGRSRAAGSRGRVARCSPSRAPDGGERGRRRPLARGARRVARPPAPRAPDRGPLALLLASLAGYGLAAAALRPVEAMRRRAAAITADLAGAAAGPPAATRSRGSRRR